MKLPLVGIAVALAFAGSGADAKLPPLRDPVFLNIGFVCQWQEACISKQQKAHKKSVAYVKNNNPPSWQVQLCNRRASFRRTGRVDWISYYHCITNSKIARGTASSRNRR